MENLLANTELNWNVRRESLMTASGLIVPKVAIVRDDTNAILGVHGDGYVEYQNSELMELLTKISASTGLEIHKTGCFGSGEKVYIQLKSDDYNIGGDTIKGYITGINSHDGSTALAFGNSTVTISCMNTFYQSLKQLDNKIKHTASMKPRIDKILYGIDLLLAEEKQHFNDLYKLMQVKATDLHKQLVKDVYFQLDSTDKLSTRKENQIIAFDNAMFREMNEKGDSLYGLFNGLTRYTTHDQFKQDVSVQNKMFGKSGELERKVFDKLLQFA